MTNYIYKGPRPSGVTLAGGREVRLHPGCRVEDLDPANSYVKTLVALGHLAEEAAAPAEPKKPKGGQS